MFSFYGDLSCKVPCIICDSGLNVLFANQTAYTDPTAIAWINEGRPNFDSEQLQTMESSFEAEPFAIAKLYMYRSGKKLTVLCEGYDPVAEAHYGRSEADAPDVDGKIYFFSSRRLDVGEFYTVKIEEAVDYDLVGKVILKKK